MGLWFNYLFIYLLQIGVVPKPILPVDDFEDDVPSDYVKGEKSLRCKVASLYRLVDYFGWTQAIYNHITVILFWWDIGNLLTPLSVAQVRVSDEEEHFLLNPFGLLYHEITASSLIKVDTKVFLLLFEHLNDSSHTDWECKKWCKTVISRIEIFVGSTHQWWVDPLWC